MWSRVIREGFRSAPRTRFIVHAGDLVSTGPSDAMWGEWHRAAGWINGSVSALPTPGNHEYSGKQGLTEHWRKQFTLPSNGVAGLEESNYYVDVQGVRMISLNSNEKRQEQAAWLDKLLAGKSSRWVLVTFHHPIYSTAKGRDNKDWRELLQPVFDRHGVDMVLTGHDHTYGRTNVVAGTNVQAGKAGTVYVVSVSGPKMYQVEPKPNMVKAGQDVQLFQVVRIDGDRLTYESRTARGVLFDAFELRKRKDQPNLLIDRMPAASGTASAAGAAGQ
jgi:3',5'-cyclic AMP phosphodiesterase CpdA